LSDIVNYINKLLLGRNKVLFDGIKSITLRVHWSLESRGLFVQVVHFSVNRITNGNLQVSWNVPSRDKRGEKIIKSSNEDLLAISNIGKTLKVFQWLDELRGLGQVRIEANETLKKYCLPHLNFVYSKYAERIGEILDWQSEIREAFEDIYFLSSYNKRAKELSLPLCYPNFSKDNSLLIKRFYPMRIVAHGLTPKPFNELFVKGIVNLCCRNGSGKTTFKEATMDIQLEAQCGLLPTADCCVFRPKKYFALSFLDRDIESMYINKAIKDRDILALLNSLDEKERQSVFVVIDECGSASTPESAITVAKDTLLRINGYSINCLMSNQHPELSVFIRDELGGNCFTIGSDYKLTSGIGEGEAISVATDVGLYEQIKKADEIQKSQ
jgi:hypothetical protein